MDSRRKEKAQFVVETMALITAMGFTSWAPCFRSEKVFYIYSWLLGVVSVIGLLLLLLKKRGKWVNRVYSGQSRRFSIESCIFVFILTILIRASEHWSIAGWCAVIGSVLYMSCLELRQYRRTFPKDT